MKNSRPGPTLSYFHPLSFPVCRGKNAQRHGLIAGPRSNAAVGRLVWLERINHPALSPPLESAVQRADGSFFLFRLHHLFFSLLSFEKSELNYDANPLLPSQQTADEADDCASAFVFVHISGCQSPARFLTSPSVKPFLFWLQTDSKKNEKGPCAAETLTGLNGSQLTHVLGLFSRYSNRV